MAEIVRFTLTLAVALGCAVVGGIFFAFSNFVMRALTRVPTSTGIATMQAINVVVLNPGFLGVFVGTAVLGLVEIGWAAMHWEASGAGYRLTGGILYVLGTFCVTRVGNIPLNDALAVVTPASAEGECVWRDYLKRWTAWNHVRTVAALLAAALFILALAVH